MNKKVKELIAIGASMGAHCQPCFAYHLGEARKLGAGENEIKEAIEVGRMVGNGAASAMRKYADEILKQRKKQSKECCPDGNSQCCNNKRS